MVQVVLKEGQNKRQRGHAESPRDKARKWERSAGGVPTGDSFLVGAPVPGKMAECTVHDVQDPEAISTRHHYDGPGLR